MGRRAGKANMVGVLLSGPAGEPNVIHKRQVGEGKKMKLVTWSKVYVKKCIGYWTIIMDLRSDREGVQPQSLYRLQGF